jgi:hypothetical protein
MIAKKEITNNPQRYKLDGEQWKVSAVADSPNSNLKGEIKELEFDFGKLTPSDSLKPLLQTDGIVVLLSSGQYLCSPNTLQSIKEFSNPHWDISSNGIIMIKDKEVVLGKTIPIIRLDINNLTQKSTELKKSNDTAGVESVEWIFEGEDIDGIPFNLINQIDWTLTEGVDKIGDTFSLWNLQLAPDSMYSIEPIVVATTQEDGKFDQKKLDNFLKEINARLNALSADFDGIKKMFYSGTKPSNSGVKRFERVLPKDIDDSPIVESFVTEGVTSILNVESTPKDKGIDAGQKATDELAKKAAEQLKVETDALKTTQRSLSEKIQEAGGVTNYVTQAGGWDKFIKEMYNKQK